VPTDDESSMTVMSRFETLIKNFPGVPSASDFEHLEKWANNTAEQWNRLSPYDENLLNARPRFLQMLAHELKKRKMAKIDKIDWGEFKAYLHDKTFLNTIIHGLADSPPLSCVRLETTGRRISFICRCKFSIISSM
jgi:hypothetical protein